MISFFQEQTSPAVDATSVDRRSAPRHEASGAAAVMDAVGRELDSELLDLCEDGAGLWVSAPLHRGSKVSLRLPTARRSGFIALGADVVDSKPVDSGVWRIACRFHRRLSPSELSAALG